MAATVGGKSGVFGNSGLVTRARCGRYSTPRKEVESGFKVPVALGPENWFAPVYTMATIHRLIHLFFLSAVLGGNAAPVGDPGSSAPLYQSELIFPVEHRHNHASCIVEAPNGDLLVCW